MTVESQILLFALTLGAVLTIDFFKFVGKKEPEGARNAHRFESIIFRKIGEKCLKQNRIIINIPEFSRRAFPGLQGMIPSAPVSLGIVFMAASLGFSLSHFGWWGLLIIPYAGFYLISRILNIFVSIVFRKRLQNAAIELIDEQSSENAAIELIEGQLLEKL